MAHSTDYREDSLHRVLVGRRLHSQFAACWPHCRSPYLLDRHRRPLPNRSAAMLRAMSRRRDGEMWRASFSRYLESGECREQLKRKHSYYGNVKHSSGFSRPLGDDVGVTARAMDTDDVPPAPRVKQGCHLHEKRRCERPKSWLEARRTPGLSPGATASLLWTAKRIMGGYIAPAAGASRLLCGCCSRSIARPHGLRRPPRDRPFADILKVRVCLRHQQRGQSSGKHMVFILAARYVFDEPAAAGLGLADLRADHLDLAAARMFAREMVSSAYKAG